MFRTFLALLFFIISTHCFSQTEEWTIDSIACALIAQMTPHEKIDQLMHDSPAIERLNIPAYNWWNEALHGVARNGRATVFPQAINLAASFDTALVHRVADRISVEARLKYLAATQINNRSTYAGLTFWSPNINIYRDPRWGRGQETYGEDPFLTGEMGLAYVRGLQQKNEFGLNAAACVKHFAVHSGPEKTRHQFNARPSDYDLQFTYFPAFKKVITQGYVEGVMCAYNRMNDKPCCANDSLLKTTLRKDWNFQGYIVTDCWAISDMYNFHHYVDDPVEAAVLALKNGVNLVCGNEFVQLHEAFNRGLITDEELNEALLPLVRLRLKLDNIPSGKSKRLVKIRSYDVGDEEGDDLANEIAAASLVLLQNKNDVLPIHRDSIQEIALIGPLMQDHDVLLANYNGYSANLTTLLEGVAEKISAGTRINYKSGFPLYSNKSAPKYHFDEFKNSDVFIVTMGVNSTLQGEAGDAFQSEHEGDLINLHFPESQVDYLRQLRSFTQQPIIVIWFSGGAMILEEILPLCDGLIWAGYPGQAGGSAIAQCLLGYVPPSGRLPFSIPIDEKVLPDFSDYSMANRTYRFSDPVNIRFPFGYGLTYNDLQMTNIKIAPRDIRQGESVTIHFTLVNKTFKATKFTFPIFISPQERRSYESFTQLAGFTTGEIEPMSSTPVTITIPAEAFERYEDKDQPLNNVLHYTLSFSSMPGFSEFDAMLTPYVITVVMD